jgi:hypothetical protein
MEDNYSEKSLEEQDRERGIVGRYMSFGRDLEMMWEGAERDADGNLCMSFGERLPYEIETGVYAVEIPRDRFMLEDLIGYNRNRQMNYGNIRSQICVMVVVFKDDYWHKRYLLDREYMEQELHGKHREDDKKSS